MNEDKGGYSIEQVGGSMFNAYRHAMDGRMANNTPIQAWQELDEMAQAAWVQAANRVAELFEEGKELSVTGAAKSVYEEFCRTIGGGAVARPYESLRRADQVAWQAVVRHALNVMSLDGDEDLEGHEMAWRDWVKQRCPELETA